MQKMSGKKRNWIPLNSDIFYELHKQKSNTKLMNQSIRRNVFMMVAMAMSLLSCSYLAPKTLVVNLLEAEKTISDGPYVFTKNDSVQVKWVSESKAHTQNITPNDWLEITHSPTFKVKFEQLDMLKQKTTSNYENVENIAVLSDIHGQYQLFVDLMKANGIVNEQGDWNYKNGHLVIVGDAFDRGEKVTETLWHIVKLKLQAEQAGGKVHFLLGNHEIMVLNADLRYLHPKYREIEQLLGLSCDQLFGKNTLMGQWLRASPIVIRINDILFNHAGLSPAMAKADMSIDSINQIFSTRIIGNHKDSIKSNPQLSLLARSQGPIWYRGYFKDEKLTTAQVDSVLNCFQANRIVVGHTSMEQVEVLFNNKVLAVDTSIKKGEKGEILLIENGKYYQAGLDGKKRLLW